MGGAHPTIQYRSVLALLTFALAVVIVEVMFVVVLIVPVDGHTNQPDEWADVDRRVLLTGGIFRAADGASAKD